MVLNFRPWPRYAVASAWLGLSGLAVSSAWAQPAPPFHDLAARIERAPAYLEAYALKEAAEARIRQAEARPNPVIGIETENVFGTGPYSGYSNAETTLSVSQDVELWGRRGARIDAARAEAVAASGQQDMARTDAIARLALAYAEAEAAQRLYELAEDARDLAIADRDAILTQVEEGQLPRLQAIQAEASAGTVQAAFEQAAAEKEAAFARLSVLAMLPEAVSEIRHSLLDQRPSDGTDLVETIPAERVAEANRLAAEKRITMADRQARPDLTASVGLRHSRMEDATAMTFGVSLPLPLFDRNRGNIQAAQADHRAASARLEAVRQETQMARSAALAQLKASASRVSAADRGVAAAEEAYRLSRIGFESGRISQLELMLSRDALIRAGTDAVEARLSRVVAEIDLARLEGRIPFGGEK